MSEPMPNGPTTNKPKLRRQGSSVDQAITVKNVDVDTFWSKRCARENHLLYLYMFVISAVSLAWVVGLWGLSFAWLLIVFVIMFAVWRTKVTQLIDQHLYNEHLLVHRKRAMRGSETAEWLNFIISRWCVFGTPGLSEFVKRRINPILKQFKPSILDDVRVESFTFGDHGPHVERIRVFEVSDGQPGGRKEASWYSIGQPPKELHQMDRYQIVLDTEAGICCEDFRMLLKTKLARMNTGPDIVVENLNISGHLQITLHFNQNIPFPHIAKAQVSFTEKPKIWFSVKVLKALQVSDIPGLKNWLHDFVIDALQLTMVDPWRYEIDLTKMKESTGPSYSSSPNTFAEGVLTLTIKGDTSQVSGHSISDIRFCKVSLGEQSHETKETQGNHGWQETCSFLVYDYKKDRMMIKAKCKRMFSSVTLMSYDLLLSSYDLLGGRVEAVLETTKEADTKLTVVMDYTPVKEVNLLSLQMEPKPETDIDYSTCTAGVMFVTVHGGLNLLAMDRSGTSDPYFVLFANRKRVKTSNYVNCTRNPKWDETAEFFVDDFTKTDLSFLIYDWDGYDANDDDFMGTTHITLSPEEPYVVYKTLNLSYNILNVGKVDDDALGSIIVSCVFRPVASVARADDWNDVTDVQSDTQSINVHGTSDNENDDLSETLQGRNTVGVMNVQSNNKLLPSGLLSAGHGLLELNIIKAKDLVAKDKNGLSDPFCVVKIGKEKKFQTTVKKKTLNPVWDEWVTMQLPKDDETLEIVVWDRDPLFMKDFIGTLTLTLDELRRISTIGEPGWYLLQKAKTGQIQLAIKVLKDDMKESLKQIESFSEDNVDADEVFEGDKSTSTPPSNRFNAFYNNGHNGIIGHNLMKDRKSKSQNEILDSPEIKMKSSTLNRAHSDVHVDKKGKFRLFRKTVSASNDEETLKRNGSVSSLNGVFSSQTELNEPGPGKYYDVKGRLSRIRTNKDSDNKGSLYCKIRIDSRTEAQRASRFSAGRVLGKTHVCKHDSNGEYSFNYDFEADKGGGLPEDTLLIIDVKSSNKNQHVATRGFTLKFLFTDSMMISRWLSLENEIQVYLELSHSSTMSLPRHFLRNPFSRISFKKKNRETWPTNM
ncbi:uncharacterized protein LOC141906731 isoform X3 [Tubulanus polymorphus]|uniref:uncharacterized protein LOC141906731 isoform X3 n=1 Tax=Tubulanus polymorphus TaxID=672921 RepID=UPI003DA27954